MLASRDFVPQEKTAHSPTSRYYPNPTLSRREWLVNVSRLSLLRWRVIRKRALPAIASTLLVWLDRWALALHKRGQR